MVADRRLVLLEPASERANPPIAGDNDPFPTDLKLAVVMLFKQFERMANTRTRYGQVGDVQLYH